MESPESQRNRRNRRKNQVLASDDDGPFSTGLPTRFRAIPLRFRSISAISLPRTFKVNI